MGGTLFYKYNGNMSILPINVSNTAPVSLKILNDLETEGMMTIITDAKIDIRDTNQFFMSFDDVIHHHYFGKGLGGITIQGLILPDCQGNLPGVNTLFDKIGKMRGKAQVLSVGSKTFNCVLVDSTLTFASEPLTNVIFQLNFAMINHNLKSPKPDNITC